MHKKPVSEKFHYAGQHNFALRQIEGARGSISQIMQFTPSLTPKAKTELHEAWVALSFAAAEIRQHRVEPDGSIWSPKE